jgi:hypothetical protein
MALIDDRTFIRFTEVQEKFTADQPFIEGIVLANYNERSNRPSEYVPQVLQLASVV